MTKHKALPIEALPHVAAYFRALSEPARLQLLNFLRDGEYSVGELAEKIGSSVANTSRHLTLLAQHGLVQRETRGNSVYYKIVDPTVEALCDLVCGSLAARYRSMDAALKRRKG